MAWVGTTRARAKINLTLQIKSRRPDGYHELESLVAFAAIGDDVELIADSDLALTVTGPEAHALRGQPDNHILIAAKALQTLKPYIRLGAFRLIKRLPLASGIGGGSADAAAALRLLAKLNHLPLNDPLLHEAALATGADVPVCLSSKTRIMRGVGEQLDPPLDLPRLFAVLVNPRISSPTPAVFKAIGLRPGETNMATPNVTIPTHIMPNAMVALLRAGQNDMQAAAQSLIPEIAEVEAALITLPNCRLARMSGSGATLFGLFDTCRETSQAAKQLRKRYPHWWIKPTLIG
jgi:4-diphosphocytidyl-2-C-methyl-D-erythritol kinase